MDAGVSPQDVLTCGTLGQQLPVSNRHRIPHRMHQAWSQTK